MAITHYLPFVAITYPLVAMSLAYLERRHFVSFSMRTQGCKGKYTNNDELIAHVAWAGSGRHRGRCDDWSQRDIPAHDPQDSGRDLRDSGRRGRDEWSQRERPTAHRDPPPPPPSADSQQDQRGRKRSRDPRDDWAHADRPQDSLEDSTRVKKKRLPPLRLKQSPSDSDLHVPRGKYGYGVY